MAVDLSENNGPMVESIAIIFAVITVIVISLRLFSRIVIVHYVGLDDALMVGACLFAWAFIIVTILAVHQGLGQHILYLEKTSNLNTNYYSFLIWLSSIFYNACLGFVKTSVLGFYTRLGEPVLRKTAIILMAVVACQATANVLVCILQCTPVSAAWYVTPGKCININAFYLINAALNITTDLITYTLPIRLIINLQTPLKQKIALSIMFGLGFIACISSIIRIIFVPTMLTSSDATWAITRPMYWSIIETNVGILASSIPSFKPIAKRYLPRIIADYNSSGREYRTGISSTKKDGSRRHFDKLDNQGIVLQSIVDPKDQSVTTTIVASTSQTSSGRNSKEDGTGDSDSEKNLVLQREPGQGQIRQWTNITRTVETERVVRTQHSHDDVGRRY